MSYGCRKQNPGNDTAMKAGIDLHDASTSACIPLPDWQDRGEDQLGICPFHLHLRGSEVLLDLAQALLYCVIGAHMEKK